MDSRCHRGIPAELHRQAVICEPRTGGAIDTSPVVQEKRQLALPDVPARPDEVVFQPGDIDVVADKERT